ncbi:MAG: NRAMP family metal ion transporter [Gammaproteobacteria bacterium GWE2_42_36]|nr:MAG: NRAMP family metal ion transporter [Gammaproteobacteria bacterium GWE2_42_36]
MRKFSLTKKLLLWLAILGPGIIVMLADTDAGSLITAAQTGAMWGYKMILLQIILIPALYVIQELTIRLGIVTGQGHGALIKEKFGHFWAWLSVSTLLICCFGALFTELAGLSGVGSLFHIPAWITMVVTITFLIVLAITGSYRSVERCALFIGLFELVFVAVAIIAHPSIGEIKTGLMTMPLHNANYLYLAAANIGAVIMPWMIFYQQSAVIDKGLTKKSMHIARWDTFIGAIVTQVIATAVIIMTAATIGKTNPGAPLDTVHQISDAITPFLGTMPGRILFALGMSGASIVAAIVVSLTAAWSIGEVTGYKCSLGHRACEAPYFYGMYSLMLILSGILVISGVNLVKMSVAIEVLNALLLPIVLGFLYLLAIKVLPEQYRLKGWYAVFVGLIIAATALFGFVSGLWGIFAG